MTIASSFQSLIDNTTLSSNDTAQFETHRRQVSSRLESRFEISKCEKIGSFARGSAIRQSSDLDLLVVLARRETHHGGEPVTSSTVLNRVRRALEEAFPATALGRDGQAIVVSFANGRSIDVVPAWFLEPRPDGWPLYAIPNGTDWWMQTSPGLHAKYISDANDRSNGQLERVAKIAKFWRVTREQPIALSGFHVELLLAHSGLCVGVKSHRVCFAQLLAELVRRECRALQDPKGIASPIPVAGTEPKLNATFQSVLASADRAARAIEAEDARDDVEARRLWQIVFNGQLPAR